MATSPPSAFIRDDDDADAPSIRVLVADDCAVNRRVMQVLLAEAGCAVCFAESGAEAVDCAGAQRFDLVVLDLNMPCLSGDEAARAIRAAGASRAAVIAQWTTDDGMRLDRSLYDARLPKPVRYEALRSLLRQARRGEELRPEPSDAPGWRIGLRA